MNKTGFRVPVLLLLTALLCLSAVLAGRSGRSGGEDTPAHPQNGAAASLFAESGLWGVKSASGRVLIEPEWYSLRVMSGDVLIARKESGENALCGLLQTSGDLIVPMIYTSFHQMADDIWAAEIAEGGKEHYHLYHADGTRWADAEWDTCTYADGLLTLTKRQDTFTYAVAGDKLLRKSWYSEHAVGLHTIRMKFTEGSLAHLPEDDVLLALGDAAADYFSYLFLNGDAPDSSLLSAEDTAPLTVARRYRNCTLASADLSRLVQLETGGYPAYLMQIQVTYKRNHTEGKPEVIRTAMYLKIARNAAGAYTYSGFTDTQMAAVSAAA